MIDYIAGLCVCFTQLIAEIWLLGPGYLLRVQSEWTYRKVSFSEQKNSIKTLYIISWNALDAFSDHF